MEKTVSQLTADLVASYAQIGGINHLDGKNLPSRRVITALARDLLRLGSPGFFDDALIHSSEIKVETAARLDALIGPLEDEIRKSLEYNPPPEYAKSNLRSVAHGLTLKFLGSLPRVRELLQTDMEAAFKGDPPPLSRGEGIARRSE